MRFVSLLLGSGLAAICLFLAGCPAAPDTVTVNSSSPIAVAESGDAIPAPQTGSETADSGTLTGASEEKPLAKPVVADSGALALTPENTRIEFVGTHVGAKPDPRTGNFEKFSGQLELDPSTNALKSVTIDIDTNSLQTEFPKLTDHLKSPDFLEVREYPSIKFQSTRIEAADAGQQQITGNLTLHGVTKEITIPAKFEVAEGAPSLHSEFDIDRSEFGMSYGPDRVENKVSLTVTVGAKKP